MNTGPLHRGSGSPTMIPFAASDADALNWNFELASSSRIGFSAQVTRSFAFPNPGGAPCARASASCTSALGILSTWSLHSTPIAEA
eukprot:CAMPEP_0184497992 /NCGR_PEP_ID=MMETSP0113_2-20130426/37888_1 /TAXON_ID=91329 /ORGANISM="Norrisiella sphaerica, Strain BC52" /LENGTH=85 /DNA_ID=CAMNT_0026885323 /DNA_START=74 /DNA_END=331 /DNA_ORIENTATION=+